MRKVLYALLLLPTFCVAILAQKPEYNPYEPEDYVDNLKTVGGQLRIIDSDKSFTVELTGQRIHDEEWDGGKPF